ncbi:MAG: Wzt carbohydrate-binding domain-containing protein [Pyrinomonadaceae bacterium]
MVVLEQGKVIFAGEQTRAIAHYLESVNTNFDSNLKGRTDRTGSGEVRVTAVEIKDLDGNPLYNAMSGQDVDIYFHFETLQNYQRSNVIMGFMVRTYFDVPVFLQHNRLTRDSWDALPSAGAFICRIRRLPLPPASYRLGLSVMCDDEYLDRIDDASELNVIEGDFYGTGEVPPMTHGCCLVDAEWRLSDSDYSR